MICSAGDVVELAPVKDQHLLNPARHPPTVAYS